MFSVSGGGLADLGLSILKTLFDSATEEGRNEACVCVFVCQGLGGSGCGEEKIKLQLKMSLIVCLLARVARLSFDSFQPAALLLLPRATIKSCVT